MTNNESTLTLNSKQLLIIIVSFQLAFLGLIALDSLNLGFPILRQLVGFFYLTFVPGFLLLGVFRINNLNALETLLYSIGLSLSFLMFIGFLMNSFYPVIGISKPISIIPLLFTITAIILLLCIIFYNRNKKLIISLSIKGTTFTAILLPTLLPFIGILGAYFLKYYDTNILLLTLFALISIFPLIVSIDKFPVKMLPFLIWIISVSLVFSHSLAFKYISYTLSDATVEYYYASLVYQNGIWNTQIFGNHNAMLRIVMLHPIHAILLNLNLTNVFMVIHPLLYSFTPLALYVLFKRQTDEKAAFLSCFFFMSLHTFFLILSRMTRTGIAELFLALFALSITDKNLSYSKKSMLSTIFALSIVVSHYGTSYLFMFALIVSASLLVLFRKFSDFKEKISILPTLSPVYVVFLLAWYMYTSTSSPFETLVKFLSHMVSRMSAMFSPETSYTIYALTRNWPFSVEISRNLIIIAYIFITAGIVDLTWNIFKRKKIKLHPEFVALSIAFFGIVLATFLPTKGFNPARILHLSLVFLAPFLITGFLKICRIFGKVQNKAYPIIAIFLIILFLFNTGFVSEVLTKGSDYSPNILISKPRAPDIDDAQFIHFFYGIYLNEKDVSSAQWLAKLRENESKIYTDNPGIFYNLIAPPAISEYYVKITNKTYIKNGYIFLRAYNIFKDIVITQTYPPKMENANKLLPLNTSNKIYTNGGSEIYYR